MSVLKSMGWERLARLILPATDALFLVVFNLDEA
jgi:hypothetical protein